MARIKDREKALELRARAMSYSQIKEKLGISKSTLHYWLRDHPLSPERIRELQSSSLERIEKTRETKRKKKEARRNAVLEKVKIDIEKSSSSLLVSGFYLYWGEGTKTAEYTTSFTNTDPAMVRCFIDWLVHLGVERKNVRLKLHMYADQNELQLKRFWAQVLNVPVANFNKTYIKISHASRKTYKGMFAHGTCVAAYHDRDVYEYVMAGVRYLRQKHGLPVVTR